MTIQEAMNILRRVAKGEDVDQAIRQTAVELIGEKLKSDNHRIAAQEATIERMKKRKGETKREEL